jgi:hypothetical protein
VVSVTDPYDRILGFLDRIFSNKNINETTQGLRYQLASLMTFSEEHKFKGHFVVYDVKNRRVVGTQLRMAKEFRIFFPDSFDYFNDGSGFMKGDASTPVKVQPWRVSSVMKPQF